MSPEQERRAEAIFMDAIALSAAERARLFDERCGADTALRAHLEELFALHEQATKFLETPPSVIGHLALKYEDLAPERLEEAGRPERLGQFTIKGVLGRGGMGIVYLAESERPRRRVALKVIRAEAASPSVLRRFEHESQVLALLQHPGIAQVYEAGVAHADGGGLRGRQPYFAMELVDGLPLTEFAAQHNLETRARLGLMARVCDAVQHAHLKGVVHRDLKPGNILVVDGGQSVAEEGPRKEATRWQPKVLDFGVARLTDADVQVTTMQTGVGQLIGTIAYMSPEQVTGDPNAVDTRSDVYALGVILYELLTGELPHRVRNVAVTEALRTIREDDPAPLSAVNRMLRGDVDTIVRKALEKEPQRRYQTAADLGADIRRYLNDEPISARPPSAVYQLGKFARRNRALVGGVAAAFLMLVLGVIGTTRMAIVAMRNERLATLKSESYERKSEFHEQLLARIAHSVESGDDESILEILQTRSRTLPLRYAGHPLERAEEERTLGAVYWVLQAYEPAKEHLSAALASYGPSLPPDDRDLLRTQALLCRVETAMGRLDEAGAIIETAGRLAAGALPVSDPARLEVESARAQYLFAAGRIAESEQLLRKLAEEQRSLAGAGDDQAEVALIQTIRDLGQMVQRQGRLEESLALYREALQRRMERPDMGPNDPDTCVAMDRVASILRDMATPESFAEAEKLLNDASAGLEATLGPDHFYTIGLHRNMATLLRARATHPATSAEQRRADLRRAQEILEHVVASERKNRGETHPRTLLALSNLVAVQFDRARAVEDPAEQAERYREAAATFKSIAEIRRQTLPEDHADTMHAENNAARALLFQARAMRKAGVPEATVAAVLSEAEALERGVVLRAVRAIGDHDWTTGHFEDRYAEILAELGRLDEAVAHSTRAVQILESTYGAEHQRTKEARGRLDELLGTLAARKE